MSSGFPAVSSDDVISVLREIGFRLKRQSGSSHAVFFRDRCYHSDSKRPRKALEFLTDKLGKDSLQHGVVIGSLVDWPFASTVEANGHVRLFDGRLRFAGTSGSPPGTTAVMTRYPLKCSGSMRVMLSKRSKCASAEIMADKRLFSRTAA